ncbi:PREDICTED: mucin-5AC-like isoform X1 [Wasmannia auropunctata]|uniref:mucin-5AC-like isoform X1 n=1 Tax=Wasmannia auropunctata TaxID=64793 RepID=UPI0005EFFDE2|nr:PREDICTED: mucin-5AC-like isoform X1 [Wasmannia auropunctata]
MWLRSVLLICGVIAGTLAGSPSDVVQISDDNLTRKNVAATTYQPPRAIAIEEFVTSHKLPENVAKPLDDDDDDEYIDEKKVAFKDNKQVKKVTQKFENVEKKAATLEPARRLDLTEEDDLESLTAKRQARVELENFSDTGKVLQEGRIKKIDSKRPRPTEQDEVIPGVYVSAEYPTTMLPILTTPREARSKDSLFDFVPVNIIREDSKDGYARFSDANFGDLGDVSLVPAGTNSRIQVKKGPNGKDYEYEYVYYYYDEEDENKAGTAGSPVTNSYDIPSRTTSAPRRVATANNNRSKYSTVERSSTVEPSNNEVIPNRNGNRGRQLVETEDISDERLPANTRFPPRSRSNHNTGTTEPSRTRSNRPRPSLDLVDSSSFRTHQEGPEFPQTLPKGPVRFLGVTPNEDNEEKLLSRNRGRPQRIQEPAPVEEVVDDTPTPRRRLSTTASAEAGVELSRGQPIRFSAEDDDEETAAPERSGNKRVSLENRTQESGETEASPIYPSVTADSTDNPTTEYPSVMDKVALDLYAFLQQGQSNLIDASSSEANETAGDSTTVSDDEITTDLTTTADLADSTIVNESTSTTTTTTTTTEPTTTTTTTTEPPTSTTQVPVGRGKFRRPGIGGPAISRNRFKSNGSVGISTTEAPLESTQKTRARFGSNGSNGGGFKRPRPGGNHKPIEEDTVQKETAGSTNAEKPPAGRGRFRAPTGGRIPVSTTTAPSNGATAAAPARPTFNKLNINRRRGRPTTSTSGGEEPQEGATHSENGQIVAQTAPESASPKSAVRTRLPGAPAIRPAIRPGGNRVNLRQKPGQTTTTTLAPEAPEGSVEEPAGEGTEEETHEAPAETSPPARSTTSNPLNKLRNRNRLQVQPKTTTKSPLPPTIRRSPLLPRRKVTETPAVQSSQEETASEEETTASETEPTEVVLTETSTAASTKHEETRGLSGLLAPRRRIQPRRPGQIVA